MKPDSTSQITSPEATEDGEREKVDNIKDESEKIGAKEKKITTENKCQREPGSL